LIHLKLFNLGYHVLYDVKSTGIITNRLI